MPFLRYNKLIDLGTLDLPEHTLFKLWYQFTAFSELYLHIKNQETLIIREFRIVILVALSMEKQTSKFFNSFNEGL